MTESRRKISSFLLIGVLNTIIDFMIYLGLYHATESIFLANTVATGTALLLSYYLNAKFTFKPDSRSKRSFLYFVAVTLFGLWVLQTTIIYFLMPVSESLPSAVFSWLGPLSSSATILLPKLVATVVSLIWNYILYNKVVFKK